MSIAAKNYAAQAQYGLQQYAEHLERVGYGIDATTTRAIASGIGKAQHFALPDGGCIFDDELRGLKNEQLRLPYPKITVEFFVPETPQEHQALPTHNPKVVVFAEEITSQEAIAMTLRAWLSVPDWMRKHDSFIFVASSNYHRGVWVPLPLGLLIPQAWDREDGVENFIEPIIKRPTNTPRFGAAPLFVLPSVAEITRNRLGEEQAMAELYHDISVDVRALLELCEALTCSNVGTEIHQPASEKNARRLAAGKLPMYETRSLVIESPKPATVRLAGCNSSRASPRQHLRRGHIKRFGDKKFWWNSCSVGDPGAGKIVKDYKVVPARREAA